jgi:hypothetical protein
VIVLHTALACSTRFKYGVLNAPAFRASTGGYCCSESAERPCPSSDENSCRRWVRASTSYASVALPGGRLI